MLILLVRFGKIFWSSYDACGDGGTCCLARKFGYIKLRAEWVILDLFARSGLSLSQPLSETPTPFRAKL
jgi:hypothetical protein